LKPRGGPKSEKKKSGKKLIGAAKKDRVLNRLERGKGGTSGLVGSIVGRQKGKKETKQEQPMEGSTNRIWALYERAERPKDHIEK